jgi:hypothetical protein
MMPCVALHVDRLGLTTRYAFGREQRISLTAITPLKTCAKPRREIPNPLPRTAGLVAWRTLVRGTDAHHCFGAARKSDPPALPTRRNGTTTWLWRTIRAWLLSPPPSSFRSSRLYAVRLRWAQICLSCNYLQQTLREAQSYRSTVKSQPVLLDEPTRHFRHLRNTRSRH